MNHPQFFSFDSSSDYRALKNDFNIDFLSQTNSWDGDEIEYSLLSRLSSVVLWMALRVARECTGFDGVMAAHLTGNQEPRVRPSAVPWHSFVLSCHLTPPSTGHWPLYNISANIRCEWLSKLFGFFFCFLEDESMKLLSSQIFFGSRAHLKQTSAVSAKCTPEGKIHELEFRSLEVFLLQWDSFLRL